MAKPKNHCFRWPKAPASHDHVKRSNNNYKNNKHYGLPGKPWWPVEPSSYLLKNTYLSSEVLVLLDDPRNLAFIAKKFTIV